MGTLIGILWALGVLGNGGYIQSGTLYVDGFTVPNAATPAACATYRYAVAVGNLSADVLAECAS